MPGVPTTNLPAAVSRRGAGTALYTLGRFCYAYGHRMPPHLHPAGKHALLLLVLLLHRRRHTTLGSAEHLDLLFFRLSQHRPRTVLGHKNGAQSSRTYRRATAP